MTDIPPSEKSLAEAVRRLNDRTGMKWPSRSQCVEELALALDEIDRLRVAEEALQRVFKLDEFLNGEPSSVEEVMNYIRYVARAALERKD